MSMKLYVGNLGNWMSNDGLARLFAKAGTVESAQIATTIAGNPRNYGFVMMASHAQGIAAIAVFDGKAVGGRILTVYEEKPPKAAAAGASVSSSQRRKENSYSASRAARWPRP